MRRSDRRRASLWLALTLAAIAGCDDAPSGTAPPPVSAPADDVPAVEMRDFVPGPMAMRRLTRGQYVSTIQAIFGADLEVLPPTEVDVRVDGLLTVGAGTASITPAGLERYEAAARQVALEVLSAERRERFLACSPADRAAPDDACARTFVQDVAPQVLRRPVTDAEVEAWVAAARSATQALGDFHQGLESVLSSWLLRPDFLFIQEQADASRAGPSGQPLTGLTLASRLSYFLWNQGPDAELLAAATAGALDTDAGYTAQIERLLGDGERLESGVRALFADLYELDDLGQIEKDAQAFPQFTSKAIEDAREQTLRTIVDHLIVQRADYRDLFTTRKTVLTRNLGAIYNVPVEAEWQAYEFPEDGARAGILSHVSFLALHARASRSSPVLRGLFVLDTLLCSPIPPPPADVNFEAIAPGNSNGATARERLAVHRADPSCAACHDSIDPVGLAFENFDAVGQFRVTEGGAPIQTHGDIFGDPYADIRGFYQALHDTPLLTRCIVRQLYSHAVGRKSTRAESALLVALTRDFERDGYDFVELMKTIALTHGFRATAGPREAAQPSEAP